MCVKSINLFSELNVLNIKIERFGEGRSGEGERETKRVRERRV